MKRILVAVDGSSTSVELVEAAVDIARSARGHRRLGREAKICLLQAITATSELPPSGLFLAPVASSASDTVARVRGFLADLERQIPEEHRDGFLVEVGSPSDVICRTARAYEADLVVIGAHRYGKLARVLDGAVVEPLTLQLAKLAGSVQAQVSGATMVDSVVVASAAQRGDLILTSDVGDLTRIRDAMFPAVRIRKI